MYDKTLRVSSGCTATVVRPVTTTKPADKGARATDTKLIRAGTKRNRVQLVEQFF